MELRKHREKVHLHCDLCDRHFKDYRARLQHDEGSHYFPCYKCGIILRSEAKRNKHEHSPHNFGCNACAMTFPSTPAREVHTKKAHVVRCTECKKDFLSEAKRYEHNKAVHGECFSCRVVFHSKEHMGQHERESHTFPCGICNRVFKHTTDRKAHTEAKHPKQKQQHAAGKTQSQANAPKKPPAITDPQKNASSQKHHLPGPSQPQSPAVPLTRPPTAPKAQTNANVQKQREIWTTPSFNMTACENCPALFVNAADKEKHVDEAHLIACPKCADRFPSILSLMNHLTGNHRHVCSLCHTIFEEQDWLAEHYKLAHHCGGCKKVFKDPVMKAKHEMKEHNLHVIDVEDGTSSKKKNRETEAAGSLNDCKTCGEHFDDVEDLFSHESVSHIKLSVPSGANVPPGFETTLTPTINEQSSNDLAQLEQPRDEIQCNTSELEPESEPKSSAAEPARHFVIIINRDSIA